MSERQPDPAEIRTEATFGHPSIAPSDLVEQVATATRAAGMRTGAPDDLGGPVRLAVRVGKRRLGILLGRVPTDGSWLVAIGGGTSPVMRMLGAGEAAERARLVETVHAVLVDLDGITGLRWHHPHERAEGLGDRARPTPWG